MLKTKLASFDKVIQLDRNEVLEFDFKAHDNENCVIVVFLGIVSNDDRLLMTIENFHLNLVTKLEILKHSKVVLISSSAVYGDYKKCFIENDYCLPCTNYGRSKLVIEDMYFKGIDGNLSVLRLGNALGLDTIGKAFRNLEVNSRYLDCRYDFSTPLRSYVDAYILFKALTSCIKFKRPLFILNVGRSKPQSMYEITHELGLECNLRKTDKILKDIVLDTSLLHGEIVSGVS